MVFAYLAIYAAATASAIHHFGWIDMLFHLDGTNRPLTPAQRKYMESMLHGEKYERPIDYENLISSGKAPRGVEVELKVGPLLKRPPQRMSQ
jgi:hypothetical protein